MPRLGVNIDHVATLREARKVNYPSPVDAALEAVRAGAQQITVHLREDRRHIQDRDVRTLKQALRIPLNLEMAATSEMGRFARGVRPATVTLVPERRQELTTEGGLDLRKNAAKIGRLVASLSAAGIRTSAFIEASPAQVKAAQRLGFHAVEFHTGKFCRFYDQGRAWQATLERIAEMATVAKEQGLVVAAGHGIRVDNVRPLLRIREIEEYNIGHSIVAMAVMTGFYQAVRKMIAVLGNRDRP